MKKLLILTFLLIGTFSIGAMNPENALKANFEVGDPGIESINSMAFGPEGILFIGDSNAAQIIAVDVSGHAASDNSEVRIDQLDKLIADMLGAPIDEVRITDMAVNPANDNIYLAAQHSSGKAILLRVENNALKMVPLQSVSHSKIALNNAVAKDAKDRRNRPLRRWAIADINYSDGKVLVSGLSNQEFASTFRVIAFPFSKGQVSKEQGYGSLEVYHAAHGKYETHAPIKTFIATKVGGKENIIAGYTCTPLVLFPMEKIQLGSHNKGRTVAELGSGNSPLDIIEVGSGDQHYLLISNNNRPLMKMEFKDLEAFQGSMTEPVTKKGAAEGVPYVNLPFVNVQQLDNLGDGFVMVQRESNGNLALKKGSSWWIK